MKIKLKNRLEVLMKDSGIVSFEEMAQRLSEGQGWKITRTSLSRKFRDEDVTVSLKMIEAICNELQCLPGDLFETSVSDASEEFVEELRARLQPFRYGSIRISKGGSEGQATGAPPATPATPAPPAPRASKPGSAKPQADSEDVTGPRISHLHAEKIKRGK
jgi:DNA-binding Xre family transcriptional regulator